MLIKKSNFIILLQAVIIVTLFWMLVFYGKDEYEAFQSEQEEEIESINRVSTEDGINKVQLSHSVQQNSGIETQKIEASRYLSEIKTFGQVLPIDVLLDAKTKFLTLNAELALAKSASAINRAQYQRMKSLNEDDKNVSDRAVQEALILVNADDAKILAAQTQIRNLKSNTQLQWGEALTNLVLGQASATYLTDLLTRKNVLVQISLPVQTEAPKKDSKIQIMPLTGNVNPITAIFVSTSPQSDTNSFGKTFFYSAPAEFLRTGMRVNVVTDPSKDDDASGVVIPNSAVVWHGGQAWIYVKHENNQFIRKPISTDVETELGWFNHDMVAGTEIVTKGAQLLLSEEFKFLIKNENDD
jgi:hypothetical protein